MCQCSYDCSAPLPFVIKYFKLMAGWVLFGSWNRLCYNLVLFSLYLANGCVLNHYVILIRDDRSMRLFAPKGIILYYCSLLLCTWSHARGQLLFQANVWVGGWKMSSSSYTSGRLLYTLLHSTEQISNWYLKAKLFSVVPIMLLLSITIAKRLVPPIESIPLTPLVF